VLFSLYREVISVHAKQYIRVQNMMDWKGRTCETVCYPLIKMEEASHGNSVFFFWPQISLYNNA